MNQSKLHQLAEKILARFLLYLFSFSVHSNYQNHSLNDFIILKLSDKIENLNKDNLEVRHTRLIPSKIKKEVWKRDQGKCVICGESKNLHFDHDLPFSKGGTSLLANNVRLLCAKCNLKKSNKIE